LGGGGLSFILGPKCRQLERKPTDLILQQFNFLNIE
jgi:hypothetical protein